MLSRVANSLYWMGRYIERAENVARFIDVNLHLQLDQPAVVGGQWDPLVTTTGDHEIFSARHSEATQENVIHFLTFDLENPNSVLSCLTAARENARRVREAISSEMWEQVNRCFLFIKNPSSRRMAIDAPHDFYSEVKLSSHLFAGTTDATMSHAEAWHFIRMGRLLERADKTSRILDVKYFIILPRVEDIGSPIDNLQWSALLKSASALEMYRKRFGRINPRDVAEFLLLDREFPRAVHYCVLKAEDSLHAVARSPAGTFQNHAEQQLGRLRSTFAYAQIDEILEVGLHESLDMFQTRLNRVDDAIHETFFALRPVETAK